ncbi:protein INSYN2B isoform X2 [Ahaetulla prasina]|uniref:protein INSYN2B isoform X2 n=1 Tax=Ahaetulla prasina TaxID=499056 RepID=UPI00264981DC|nr:protein INSYN2B isoform X2 [Ahaetulla prasina]
MGRKETYYLHMLNCDSMAQQGIKVRPVLLKRNSLDSVDFRRQPHHRRSKSQQVRFKEDGANNPTVVESELEAGDTQDPCVLDKIQTSQAHDLVNNPFSLPPSCKGLQNIAIQTSPSLRKHFPVFKKKRITTSKSLTEMPKESEYAFQVNGNLSQQDIISSSLSYLSIAQRLNDGPKATANTLFRRVPKAQSNGPVHLGSDQLAILETTTVSTQVPEYAHLGSALDNFSIYPDTQVDLRSSTDPSPTKRESEEICSMLVESENLACVSQNCNDAQMGQNSCEEKCYTELPSKNDISAKENFLPLSQFHHNPLPCSLPQPQQSVQLQVDTGPKIQMNDNQTTLFTINSVSPLIPSCQSVTENISTNTEVPQYNCLEGFHINAYLSGAETKSEKKEIKEINQIHLAHSELCALQGRLQSVEESLLSNQEKIKVLLNVIQDMEKARALNEGVEHDFRQQEDRFHQVLKALDQVEESPVLVTLQRQPSDYPVPEKQEIRRKAKKKKCFWWI